jgi:hypothetical protein
MAQAINVPVDSFIPLKLKTWVTVAGSVLMVVGPWILTASTNLPEPWPAIVGGIFGILTILGVYHAPYVPKSAQVSKTPISEIPSSNGPGESPWPG